MFPSTKTRSSVPLQQNDAVPLYFPNSQPGQNKFENQHDALQIIQSMTVALVAGCLY